MYNLSQQLEGKIQRKWRESEKDRDLFPLFFFFLFGNEKKKQTKIMVMYVIIRLESKQHKM